MVDLSRKNAAAAVVRQHLRKRVASKDARRIVREGKQAEYQVAGFGRRAKLTLGLAERRYAGRSAIQKAPLFDGRHGKM